MKKILFISLLGLGITSSLFAEITLKDVKTTSVKNEAKIRQGYIDQALLTGLNDTTATSETLFGSKMSKIGNTTNQNMKNEINLPNDFFKKELNTNNDMPPIKL